MSDLALVLIINDYRWWIFGVGVLLFLILLVAAIRQRIW